MNRQKRSFESIKSVAGGVLVGLGLHILSGNVEAAVAPLSRVLPAPTGEELGALPSAILAVSQVVKSFSVDRQALLLDLLRLVLSFWPLLLVIAGALLLRDALKDKARTSPVKFFPNNLSKIKIKIKDVGCRFCCPSFDV